MNWHLSCTSSHISVMNDSVCLQNYCHHQMSGSTDFFFIAPELERRSNLPALFHFASEHNATTHAQLFTNPRTPNRAATANLSLISFPYHTKLKCGPRYAPVFSIKYTQPKHPLFQSGHVRAPCWAIREYASELRCDTPEPQSAGPIPIQRCICFLFYNFVLNAQYYYQIHAKWPKNSIFKF